MEEQKRQDLKVRTREFALQIVSLYTALPKTTESHQSMTHPSSFIPHPSP